MDGENDMVGAGWLGGFMPHRRRRNCRFVANRGYRPVSR